MYIENYAHCCFSNDFVELMKTYIGIPFEKLRTCSCVSFTEKNNFTNFTSLSRVSRHALANIGSTTPSTVQTRNQAAFFLASRACKSMWTAALSRADTISVIPARGPTHRRQAGGSLKTLCANAQVWHNAGTAIITTSSTKWCLAANALVTSRTPGKMKSSTLGDKEYTADSREPHLRSPRLKPNCV